MSVWTIGGEFDSAYEAEQRDENGNDQTPQTGDALAAQDTDDGESPDSQHDGLNDTTAEAERRVRSYTSLLRGNSESSAEGPGMRQAAGGVESDAPSLEGSGGIIDGAIAEPSVSGTTAYIGDGAVVDAGDDVGVRAKERVDFLVIAGSGAGGLVGVGGSVAVVNIRSDTEAFIGDATVSAGPDSGDNIAVEAGLVSDVRAVAFAGQAGLVGLGAQVAYINDSSHQTAHINGGASIQQAGGSVNVLATGDRDLKAEAAGGAIGGVTLGVAVAMATAGGESRAWVAGDVGRTPEKAIDSVDVSAESVGTVQARSTAVSSGFFFGGSGSVAIAKFQTTVEGSIHDGAGITASGDVAVTSRTHAGAQATAAGVNGSVGAAMGTSVAVASISPTLTSSIEDASIRLMGDGEIRVEAIHEIDTGHGAEAAAMSVSGSLIVGLAGACASATNSPVLDGYLASGAVIESAGEVIVRSTMTTRAEGDASGGGGGGVVGIGASVVDARARGRAKAYVAGEIESASAIMIESIAATTADAGAKAVAGGIVAGAGGDAEAVSSPVVEAYSSAASHLTATGAVEVSATLTPQAVAVVEGTSGGAFDVGVSRSIATVAPLVRASVGGGERPGPRGQPLGFGHDGCSGRRPLRQFQRDRHQRGVDRHQRHRSHCQQHWRGEQLRCRRHSAVHRPICDHRGQREQQAAGRRQQQQLWVHRGGR